MPAGKSYGPTKAKGKQPMQHWSHAPTAPAVNRPRDTGGAPQSLIRFDSANRRRPGAPGI